MCAPKRGQINATPTRCWLGTIALQRYEEPLLFCLNQSYSLGKAVAGKLGWPLSAHEEIEFEYGEHKSRPLVEVGGRDIYVLHHLDGKPEQSANDKIVHLLFFIGALKQAGARNVSAIVPYLPYSRKERRTKPRDPVNSRYLAALFEALATDTLVTVEIHNIAAFENAFHHCRAENLTVAGLMADHIAPIIGNEPVTVVSPDAGGAKRAELFRTVLEKKIGRPVMNAMLEKYRSAGVISGSLFAGDVNGHCAVIIDDMISSGGTILRATRACRDHGAKRVIAAAAHGLFTNGADALFAKSGPDIVLTTDSVDISSTEHFDRLQVVSIADLLADTIKSLSNGDPLYDLLPYN